MIKRYGKSRFPSLDDLLALGYALTSLSCIAERKQTWTGCGPCPFSEGVNCFIGYHCSKQGWILIFSHLQSGESLIIVEII